MNRTTAVGFALLVLAASGWLLYATAAQQSPSAPAPVEAAEAGPHDAGSAAPETADADADAAGWSADDELQPFVDWSRYPDGAPVPPLPSDAPRSVHFGAFLVSYRGAEYAPRDAPERDEALELATRLLGVAQRDFEEAVEEAHAGGSDLGRIQRGILEPALEHALFSLAPGEIHPVPVDSPRGFWVLRRLD